MSTGQPQQISVDDLNVNQLVDVRRQLEEELTHLSNSLVQLRAAQSKFQSCIENVKDVGGAKGDASILVPLTNSCYVPGKLKNPDHVIVDVGTGYFIQKTRTQAMKYYTEKVTFIKGNVDKLDETVTKKRENLSMLVGVLQTKVQAQSKQQTPSAAGTNS